MKLTVMSCIHGNYTALNATLSDINTHHVDKIYFWEIVSTMLPTSHKHSP
jgi:hypothetical protein